MCKGLSRLFMFLLVVVIVGCAGWMASERQLLLTENAVLKPENEKLREENGKLQADHLKLAEENSKLKTDLAAASNALEELKKQLQGLEAENKRLVALLADNEAAIAALNSQLAIASTAADTAIQNSAQCQGDLDQKSQDLAKREKELAVCLTARASSSTPTPVATAVANSTSAELPESGLEAFLDHLARIWPVFAVTGVILGAIVFSGSALSSRHRGHY